METRSIALLFAIAVVVAISLIASGCTQQGGSYQAPANNSQSPGSLPDQTGTGQQTAQTNTAP